MVSARAQNWINQAKGDKTAFLASSATLYNICLANDEAAAEVAALIESIGLQTKVINGRLYAAKDPAGPDLIYEPVPQLPLVDTAAKVIAFGVAQGWWRAQ